MTGRRPTGKRHPTGAATANQDYGGSERRPRRGGRWMAAARASPVTRQLSSHYCCRGEDGEDSRGEEHGRITPVIGASLAGLGTWLVIAVLGPHLARRLPP